MMSWGCFVEDSWLRNAFRWRETIGPWEERPGHYGDVWNYWTDDGLGYYEFLQLAEDMAAAPIWLFNVGSLEFARGNAEATWGSVRAAMGHHERFPLKYVAIGNEDCEKEFYKAAVLRSGRGSRAAGWCGGAEMKRDEKGAGWIVTTTTDNIISVAVGLLQPSRICGYL